MGRTFCQPTLEHAVHVHTEAGQHVLVKLSALGGGQDFGDKVTRVVCEIGDKRSWDCRCSLYCEILLC